jgi:outer membrane immunogenic protein
MQIKTFKFRAIALLAVVGAAGPSYAQDWSGFYAGLNSGRAFGESDYVPTDPILNSPPATFDGDGQLFGAQVGYNMQSGTTVYGIQADVSGTDISASTIIDPMGTFPTNASYEANWVATVRGRVGVTKDAMLIYATAGLALTEASATVTNLTAQGDDRTRTETFNGYTIGFGTEHAITETVSITAEYLYSDFGSATFNFGSVFDLGDLTADGSIVSHSVKVGLNYRF